MDEIRSWWEVPCIAHYCYLFRNAFKLPPFEIEELEDALLVDHTPDPSSLLVEIHCIFLGGICGKQVTEENWSFMLKLHLEWRVDYLKETFNPMCGDQEYKDLAIREKVELLHKLCHWRLELDDIADLLKGLEALDLRLEPIGKDGQGYVYWYFYGTRLYREPVENYKQRARVNKTAAIASSKPSTSRKKTSKSKKPEPEATEEAERPPKEEWELLCGTSEAWEELTESFHGSKQSYERSLFKVLNDELLPDVLQLIAAKEKKYKKKLLLDAPRRQSSRIALKTEEHMAALEREKHREEQRRIELEEMRIQEEQAAEDRRKMEEEAQKKAEEEAALMEKVRKQEEEKWEMALSGELSGPRKAAVGATETTGVVADVVEADRDEELYTSMYKVCSDVRKHEDGWVFVDPVTDDIAPGYSEMIKEPMDIVTIEQKLADSKYSSLKEFVDDFHLMFDNCYEYNGSDSEYGEVADTVKKYFKKLCKRYFNEVYLKEKEEKERTPSPDHEKAIKDLEDESESDDSSGSDSDASEFGVAKKPKRGQMSKSTERDQPSAMESAAVAGMWHHSAGRGAMGPNGLTINSGTLENLRRLHPHGNYSPRMPHGLPPLPPNAPPHIQQEYYAKLQMMQQRQRYMQEMMRRQQQHQQQQHQQRPGYPRFPPGVHGMEGMPPSAMQHGMPPQPSHPDAYGNMMTPPNYQYPGDHMMQHPYQHPAHQYRGPYPPYRTYPNNPQEHYRMPPPDYNEAAKAQMEWLKSHTGAPPTQREGPPPNNDGASVKSPSGNNSRHASVSSDGMVDKSPPVTSANAMQLPHSNSSLDTQAAPVTSDVQAKTADRDSNTAVSPLKDNLEQVNSSVADNEQKTASETTTSDGTHPVPVGSEEMTSDSKQQPSNEAYKRGMEAAYKYHQEQLKRKQVPQPLPPPGYSPGLVGPDVGFSHSPQGMKQQTLTPKQQHSYMQWRQQQEAMWMRSQQMGMQPSPMGSPYTRNPPGGVSPMYGNPGYHSSEGTEPSEAYKQQQLEYHQRMQQQQQQQQHQYMMNRKYMEDMYRQQRYGHPGMHASTGPYPYGHHPGYGRPHYPSATDRPNPDANPMQAVSSPRLQSDSTAPSEEIPDYSDSLRKYAMELTGSADHPAENTGKSMEDSAVSSSKDDDRSANEEEQAKVESSVTHNDDKEDANRDSGESVPSEVESTTKLTDTKSSSEGDPVATDDTKMDKDDGSKSVSSNVISPSSSSFPVADSTTHDGTTPGPTPGTPSRQPSQPGAAHNGYKGHYPPSVYPPQHAYGGWHGMPVHHPAYNNRGMYPPPSTGRPDSIEEYEQYRVYHEQMMAMRQMPPQDPYHGMGMSPYEMEQYHHYNMMQQRMGAGPPQHMGRSPHPQSHSADGEQPKHGVSHEDMKRYQMKQEQLAAMHQMRTAYQQQHHPAQYGPPPTGPAPSMFTDYTAGMMTPPQPSVAASMSSGEHPKMSVPSQKHGMQQPSSAMADVVSTPEVNSNQKQSSTEGTDEPPSKKTKLDC